MKNGKEDTDRNKNAHNSESAENGLGYKNLSEIVAPYFQKLWKSRKWFLLINGIAIAVVIIYQILFVKPYYTSTVTIFPDYGSKSSSLGFGGLAAMAGISLGEGGNTLEIYKDLLKSESVIEPVVYAHYYSQIFKDSLNLIQYFRKNQDDSIDFKMYRRDVFLSIYGRLGGLTQIDIEPLTKIMKVTVTMPEAQLSSAVVNKLVNSLDIYVRTKRKSNASMQRMYIEQRIADVKDSLSVAENTLKIFSLSNRNITQSPDLILEQSRLNRQVQILQTVYAELMRQLEITKIDEIRDSPIVNIREWSKEPVLKAGPSMARAIFFVFCTTLMLTGFYFLFFDNVRLKMKQLISNVIEVK